jgi:hypothetical protein
LSLFGCLQRTLNSWGFDDAQFCLEGLTDVWVRWVNQHRRQRILNVGIVGVLGRLKGPRHVGWEQKREGERMLSFIHTAAEVEHVNDGIVIGVLVVVTI